MQTATAPSTSRRNVSSVDSAVGAGSFGEPGRVLHGSVDHCDEEVFLAGEVAVHRRPGDADRGADLVDPRLGEPALAEQSRGGVEDLLGAGDAGGRRTAIDLAARGCGHGTPGVANDVNRSLRLDPEHRHPGRTRWASSQEGPTFRCTGSIVAGSPRPGYRGRWRHPFGRGGRRGHHDARRRGGPERARGAPRRGDAAAGAVRHCRARISRQDQRHRDPRRARASTFGRRVRRRRRGSIRRSVLSASPIPPPSRCSWCAPGFAPAYPAAPTSVTGATAQSRS